VIRRATADDAAAIRELEALLFGPDAWSVEQVLEELTGAGRRAWLAGSADDVDGYVITWDNGDVVDLQRIAVRPARQRSGLATELIEAALADVDRMLLEVAEDNEAALAFYRQRGFVEIDRRPRYYRSGAAAIVMGLGSDQGR
jgi:ribosomal protein S18 acetylase RimI-like enzyme